MTTMTSDSSRCNNPYYRYVIRCSVEGRLRKKESKKKKTATIDILYRSTKNLLLSIYIDWIQFTKSTGGGKPGKCPKEKEKRAQRRKRNSSHWDIIKSSTKNLLLSIYIDWIQFTKSTGGGNWGKGLKKEKKSLNAPPTTTTVPQKK